MRILNFVLIGVLVLSCSKSKAPAVPGVATLVFPEQNSICTTGEDLSATNSRVTFSWLSAPNTTSYELSVTNLNTNTTETMNTTALAADMVLVKGTPYNWRVTSSNNEVTQTTPSAVWVFYNAGSQTSHPPFPTQIILPKSGATVFRDPDNTILLRWEGFDVDNDIVEYEVYADKTVAAESLITTTNASTRSFKLSVDADSVYYWKVVARDSEGNIATSNVYSFKVL